MKYKKIMLIGLTLCGFTYAKADVNQDLKHYFDKLGYASNTTRPHAYKGQSAGYYTGGSLFARSGVRDVTPVNIQLPSYHAGCGGIDLFTGGFSFITADELRQTLKNIANNAGNFAFSLGMKTVMPSLENLTETYETWQNRVNNLNISSCTTGASLVGSLWPKTDVAQDEVCKSIATGGGLFSDYAAARQACGPEGNRAAIFKQANARDKNRIIDNTNLAWRAIQKNSLVSGDTELSELLMSLSGTIIVTADGSREDSHRESHILPSLADDQSLVKALLYGGRTSIYRCNGRDACLSPKKSTIIVQEKNALATLVKTMLLDMKGHILSDTAITNAEKGLLQSTALPIYKLLNVQSAYASDAGVIDIEQYADVIAAGILYQYLNENLSLIQASANQLQYPTDFMQRYMKGIENAREAIRHAESTNYQHMNQVMSLISQSQLLEKQLAGRLSRQLSNRLRWTHGRGA